MKEGFTLGARVRTGNSSTVGTLIAKPGPQKLGTNYPHYDGEGWYFVKWDTREEIFIAHEDDLFLVSVDDRYRAAAKEYVVDGDLELDDDAKVSISDGGAYVQMWKWVAKEDL